MHGDGLLGSVGELFSTHFHITFMQENVPGIKVLLMGWVRMWCEDQGAFNHD